MKKYFKNHGNIDNQSYISFNITKKFASDDVLKVRFTGSFNITHGEL